ncbi:Hypothetical protein NTJ_12183 [Nesidiocoris tenuis]|uniref:Uncharacterized protein n=1 Tax=Nesidiocoris tenuis TaxID=355587 RepID=A0ABN7B4M8_9HEMI|nr:Hypothetical protein NTJ_12183 [Nesidiocoris tenuis]
MGTSERGKVVVVVPLFYFFGHRRQVQVRIQQVRGPGAGNGHNKLCYTGPPGGGGQGGTFEAEIESGQDSRVIFASRLRSRRANGVEVSYLFLSLRND